MLNQLCLVVQQGDHCLILGRKLLPGGSSTLSSARPDKALLSQRCHSSGLSVALTIVRMPKNTVIGLWNTNDALTAAGG